MRTMSFRNLILLMLIPISVAAAERGNVIDRSERDRIASARHFILEPQHVLSDAERAELAADGVTIQRALSGGRYLVRVANDSTFDGSDPRVISMKALSVEDKLQRSAYRAAAQTPFARVKIIFHDDASIDDALSAIESIGGLTLFRVEGYSSTAPRPAFVTIAA